MLVAKPIIGFYKRSIARSAFMVHVMPVMAEVILSNHYSLTYNTETYMQDIFFLYELSKLLSLMARLSLSISGRKMLDAQDRLL